MAVALLGISTLALASAQQEKGHDCPKNCVKEATTEGLIPATPRPDAPSMGPADARVTVEVWSDFQCPFCARGANTIAQLRKQYGDKIRIVFRHSPLPFHGNARLAAAASMAAHEQGKFWQFHDSLFANQGSLDRAGLEAQAQKLGLDLAKFRRSLESKTWDAYLDLEVSEAHRRGVAGTPTFFVNDQPVVGAQPIENFTGIIDAALKR